MKTEQTCKLSDSELIEKEAKWVDKLCKSGGAAWSLQVPVNFDEDPDIIFSEIIKRFSIKIDQRPLKYTK